MYLDASPLVPQVKVTSSNPDIGAVNFTSGTAMVAPLNVRLLRWFSLPLPILYVITRLYDNNVDETSLRSERTSLQ